MPKRSGIVFFAMIPIGAFAGLLIAVVITWLMPKIYESEAVIEVRTYKWKDYSGEKRPDGVAPEDYVSPLLLGEIAKLKSRDTLLAVIDRLELVKRWHVDKETALHVLNGNVVAGSIRGSDLVSIRVRHTNKVDACDIAMEVVRVYKNDREEMDQLAKSKDLAQLDKAVKDQEDKVEESRKILAKLVRNSGPHPELYMHDASTDTPYEVILRSKDKRDYDDAKRNFEQDWALMENLKLKQKGETIIQKLPTDSVEIHQDPVIADSPVSPNVTLNLVSGTVLGLLLFPLFSLPVMKFITTRSTR